MGKLDFKPGNMLYPLPAVMVSVRDKEGNDNIITVAWTGTVCTNPPMLYISVRPERHSYKALHETGEFVVNLTTEKLAKATDFCGVRSGRDMDKFEQTDLKKGEAKKINAPVIEDSPVNIECRVREEVALGSHTMFIADVVHVTVDDAYMDEKGKFELNKTGLLAYSHGEYLGLGKKIGTFGYSVRKKKTVDKRTAKKITTKNESRSKKSPEKRNVNKNTTFRKKGKAKK